MPCHLPKMNLLYRNDRPGAFPESWYAATAEIPPARPPLGWRCAGGCLRGGGGLYTGLCAALELAKRGSKVIVLEAHRAGFGASGRNGGQVGSGFNKDQRWIEARVGGNAARALWDMAEAAKEQVRTLCRNPRPRGALHATAWPMGPTRRARRGSWRRTPSTSPAPMATTRWRSLDRDAMQSLVKTPHYAGGILDRGAGHIHPLRYALGLARKPPKRPAPGSAR